MPPRLAHVENWVTPCSILFSCEGRSQHEGAYRMGKHAYQAHFDEKIYRCEHICLVSIISKILWKLQRDKQSHVSKYTHIFHCVFQAWGLQGSLGPKGYINYFQIFPVVWLISHWVLVTYKAHQLIIRLWCHIASANSQLNLIDIGSDKKRFVTWWYRAINSLAHWGQVTYYMHQ